MSVNNGLQELGSRIYHVAVLVLLGLAARLTVFKSVAVNGDSGLYLYDAMQILEGKVMFVDFASRSPLMEHLLAAVIWLPGPPLHSVRAAMVAVGLTVGILVYVLGRQLHSHWAGLAGMAIYYLSPFSLVWGMWLKTEQVAAVFMLLAAILTMYTIDAENLPLWLGVALGGLFGAAFLVRRVVFVHLGALGLFLLYYRVRTHDDRVGPVVVGAVTVAVGILTLMTGYLLTAHGDAATAVRIADQHAVALFASNGQGSLGYLPLTVDPDPVTAESRGSVLASLCQKCGPNTVDVFLSTFLVTLPAALPVLGLLRSYLDTGNQWLSDTVLPTALATLGLFGAYASTSAGYPMRAVAAVSLTLAVILVWFSETPDFGEWWDRRMLLPIFIVFALAAGYLYRDRILYVTYFQDFYAWIALLAGISLTMLHKRNRYHLHIAELPSIARTVGLTVLVVSALAASGAAAYPYQPDGPPDQSEWFSAELVNEYGDDMDQRVDDGKTVFTAQPLYVVHSDVRPTADLSRKYYLYRGWPDNDATKQLTEKLLAEIAAGNVQYAIIDGNMMEILDRSPALRAAIDEEFCATDDELYEETGGELLQHESEGCNE